MQDKNKTFYITTPIYYVNGAPHVGSCYTTLACDVMARFKKMDGFDVKFLTGTDEHGQKIEQASQKAGKTPQEFVDEVSETFVDLIKLMNFEPSTFDALGKYKDNDFSFIRTTNKNHKKVVQDVWKRLVDNKWIYKDKYSGWYCVSDEAYYTEDDLTKDENGEWKTDLGKSVEWKEEESYFFRLSEFKDILLALYKYYPDFVQPKSRRNEVISFVETLDRDLSISRNSFDWGIKIPCDLEGKELLDKNNEWKADVEPKDRHVIYVWLDALFNYISALGGLNGGDYKKYWKQSKNKIHIMAKEIIRFHAVFWPAFLIACEYSRKDFESKKADKNFTEEILGKSILSTTVFAHGFWEAEGRKMSKSFGNVIYPVKEIKWLQDEFGISKEVAIDYFRYFLITEIPFGNDGNYTRQRLVDRINAELVNNIGNLAQRTLSMIYKNCDGEICKSNPTPNSPLEGESRKRAYKGEADSVGGYKHLYSKETLSRAKELRQNTTDAEGLLWYYLRNKQLGYKFRRQQPIDKYIVDFVCFEKKLVIELDGGQHNEDKNIKYDNKRSEYLKNQGFNIIRVWNNEMFTNTDGVLNTIWNFLHKGILSLTESASDSVLASSTLPQGESEGVSNSLLQIKSSLDEIRQVINNFEYDTYAKEILKLSSSANEFIEQQKPWELKKTNPEKLKTVLYILAEAIRKIAILLQPFCPTLAKKMLQQLKVYEQYNIQEGFVPFKYLQGEQNRLKSGIEIEKPEGVFPRLKKK